MQIIRIEEDLNKVIKTEVVKVVVKTNVYLSGMATEINTIEDVLKEAKVPELLVLKRVSKISYEKDFVAFVEENHKKN